jgi:SAM-dependent methyltransferase
VLSSAFDEVDITDERFDRMYSEGQQARSYFHWTPIDVALRACTLLAPRPDMRVLDVGSGVGKLCIIGALTTSASWVGVERDANMIRAANKAATRLRLLHNVQFVHGDAHELDWSLFDSIYMFNPFAEGLYCSEIDPAVRRTRYIHDVERSRSQLASLRAGAQLVTYHGFGGEVPDELTLEHSELAHEDYLCVWTRRGRRRAKVWNSP